MSDTEFTIKTVLAGVLGPGFTPEQIASDADLVEEYGLDSLQTISFLLGIEDAFDLELDYETLELDHLRSVGQFTEYVTSINAFAAG
ncbi:acyl carrier protein [Kibdelosporangium phytohabitans]|uniref:Acyl carrier protein n=1 Tax=Kibdelosporangium phytohabitans TaxID=860235 RepID=A0A0N9IDS7_9PSEU|nr:phosphopantetheine-binding protein [Kibdelosporangium phytohabitans]ALG14597.1 acyl carrier protein [Kibdelosporangium phytohabitans]MBE1467876.1 acyl carrier protein [Kibdelosporangium phytohabitans]